MSGEVEWHSSRRGLAFLATALLMGTSTASWGGDWWPIDPLNTLAPVMQTDTQLPGDAVGLMCEGEGGRMRAEAMPDVLSLAQAVDLALCLNPQIKATWAAIKVQAAGVGQAKAAFLPTLSYSTSELRDQMRYPGTGLASHTARNATQYANLTWRLVDFGGRAANQRSAAALLDAALAAHDAALQKMLASVIQAYFDAQAARAVWYAKKEMLSLAQQTLETSLRREARGAGSQTDTLQAQTAQAKAALEYGRSKGAYQKAMALLQYTMGLSAARDDRWAGHDAALPKDWVLAQDVQESSPSMALALDDWLTQALATHPALRSARAQVLAAQEKAKGAQQDGLPTLDFATNYYQNGRPSQGLSPRTRETVTGITLNVPLSDGFATTYKIRSAQAQVEQKKAEQSDIEQQVAMEVMKAYADAASALNVLTASDRLLQAASGALSSMQRKFDKGAADILEILNVQAALADAHQERIKSLADWRSARLRLMAQAGVLGRAEFVR